MFWIIIFTAPVVAATAYACYDGVVEWGAALLCLLFALLAQIASNMGNDYYDYKKGGDSPNRVGPQRAVVSGLISPQAMLLATMLVLAAACCVGLGLVAYGGWQLIPVGAIIAIFALAYSAGPFPLSRYGLGDVTVFIFFGLIAVNFTYYVQAGCFTIPVLMASVALFSSFVKGEFFQVCIQWSRCGLSETVWTFFENPSVFFLQ